MIGMKKEFYNEFYKKIGSFFKECFNLPYTFYKTNNNVDMLQLDEVEESMVDAFKQFVIKLNED